MTKRQQLCESQSHRREALPIYTPVTENIQNKIDIHQVESRTSYSHESSHYRSKLLIEPTAVEPTAVEPTAAGSIAAGSTDAGPTDAGPHRC